VTEAPRMPFFAPCRRAPAKERRHPRHVPAQFMSLAARRCTPHPPAGTGHVPENPLRVSLGVPGTQSRIQWPRIVPISQVSCAPGTANPISRHIRHLAPVHRRPRRRPGAPAPRHRYRVSISIIATPSLHIAWRWDGWSERLIGSYACMHRTISIGPKTGYSPIPDYKRRASRTVRR
jgi:hypothetical protein